MKTKSKLVLGLSILSAATLAAGATSTFAWYQAAFTPVTQMSGAIGAVMNNSTFASISLAETKVIANDTHTETAASATETLLPATNGTAVNNVAAQVNTAFSKSDLKTYIDTDSTDGVALQLDHTVGSVGIKFKITMAAAAGASAERKYELTVKLASTATLNNWCIAKSTTDADSSYTLMTIGSVNNEVQAYNNIVQGTSDAQNWYFLLWVDGTNVSAAVDAISNLVTFTLNLL